MARNLNINVNATTRALQDSEAFEAFTLAMLVKATVTSGCIHDSSIRNICRMFGISATRCCRAKRNAIRLGYLRVNGKSITATCVHHNEDYVVPISVNKSYVKDGQLYCGISFKEMQEKLYGAVVLNHVRKQEDCKHTYCAAQQGVDSFGHPLKLSRVKAAKKRLLRMAHTPSHFEGLSLARVMQLLHVSRYTARKILKGLLTIGLLAMTPRIEVTNIDPDHFSETARRYMQEIQGGGWLYGAYIDGRKRIVCRRTNIYRTTNPSNVRLVYGF